MIRNFHDIDRLAHEGKPLRLAALAADEHESLLTIKLAREKKYIEPCIIGQRKKIEKIANEIGLDLKSIEIIEESDQQKIADKGIDMLFSGEIDIPIKGHIPTAFIYRSIIKHEKAIGKKSTISVNTFWDIPEVDHLITITDTGVSIKPDAATKKNIIHDAVFLMKLLGYKKPKVLMLSSYTGLTSMLDSFQDAEKLKKELGRDKALGAELLDATSLADVLCDEYGKKNLKNMPHVVLVPHLDAGNILSKLDFMMDVTRRSFVLTTKGPVIVPSRSDTHKAVIGEIALGVVFARLLKGIK
jgi:phosphate butyryltransferase